MSAEKATAPPGQIGPYRILEEIGHGGMGVVYKAEQREPVRRLVALKVVQVGIGTKEVLARFQLERRALAAMNHRCIAKVLDAGATDKGEPFFVMELVEGLPLTDYCDKHKLSLNDRLKLFQLVCEGAQHAHLKGVVHRDLKPGNVLVVREGEQAVPKILDFGLAKATNRDFLDATLFTEKDRVLGTPEYMSPEQAAGDGEAIDARADIYSLGVMLYELLCGELPFPTAMLKKAGALEAMRLIREQEPTRPSTKVSSRQDSQLLAEQRRTSVPVLRRALAGDLDWIAMKAMAKEPERRYDAATALAADVGRYLEHLPVLAGPPSFGYRLRKFVRRYRVQVIAAAVVFVAIVGGGIGTALGFKEALWERNRADAKVQEFNQLSGVVLYDRAVASEKDLYPPWPQKIEAMKAWLSKDAGTLLAMRSSIEQTARSLEGRTLESERFLRDTLQDLLKKLANLEQKEKADVERDLLWAQQVGELTLAHPKTKHAWAEARAAIAKADDVVASQRYAGQNIELRDQDVIGLVPIGMNLQSKLWEFYELRSAWDGVSEPKDIAIPEPDADGGIQVGDSTGIVFVLLPGGTFTMGAQKDDANGSNYDPQARSEETRHEVTLSPFFLSRYEMTQGQWARMWAWDESRRQPSQYKARNVAGHEITLANPVEQVDWTMCDSLLRRHGLVLPTETQWEYGCRAGSATPWLIALKDLKGYANVADATARGAGVTWACESWTDGHVVHARVGSFLPNAFGLFDVHGNVWEWCQDEFGSYSGAERAGDGLRLQGDGSSYRCIRGGGFDVPSALARSAHRRNNAPSIRGNALGVRPARAARLPD